jgi:DNA-binding XRE family transcriptional regulator
MKLLNELKQIQTYLKLNDSQMAKQLKVHRVTWVNIKNGKRPMSAEFKLKAIQAFPKLQGIFLTENAT